MPVLFPAQTAFATLSYQEESQHMDIAPDRNLQEMGGLSGGRMSAECS
jgi:hypothetical protein